MFKINKMDFLVGFYVFGIIVSELMGVKTFPLVTIGDFTLNASIAIFLLPLLFTINDVVIEVYGVSRARSIVRTGLLTIILLFCFIMLSLKLPPSSRFIESNAAFAEIFGKYKPAICCSVKSIPLISGAPPILNLALPRFVF